MSSDEAQSNLAAATAQVCCTSGTPKNNASTGTGSQLELAGMRHYVSGSGRSLGIMVAYDIFGFDIGQTRQFIDDLVQATNATAIMPDLLMGKPWSLAEFPPTDKDKFNDWLSTTANVENARNNLLKIALPALRERLDPQAKIAIIGFCWGARVAMTTCGADNNPFSCCVGLHPAFVTEELIQNLRVPVALLPAEDDPDMQAVFELLKSHDFYSRCIHKKFMGVQHGFCAARGDRNDAKQMQIINEACNMAAKFIKENAAAV